jgi:hypothetical protein
MNGRGFHSGPKMDFSLNEKIEDKTLGILELESVVDNHGKNDVSSKN